LAPWVSEVGWDPGFGSTWRTWVSEIAVDLDFGRSWCLCMGLGNNSVPYVWEVAGDPLFGKYCSWGLGALCF